MLEFEGRFAVRRPAPLMPREGRQLIHEAALDVLESTGVRIGSAAARQELKAAGALVDADRSEVKLPRDVVESLVRKAPSALVLAGREKEFDLRVDWSHSYYTTDGCGVVVWDAATGSRRLSMLEDIRRTAIIGDWLPYVSIYEPMVVAHDVPEKAHVVAGMRAAMEHTQKHLLSESTSNAEEAKAQVRMAAEVVGSVEELRKRHYISAMFCPTSPLMLDEHATDAMLVWAEHHVPIHITGMAQAGISGPVTLAGDLVVDHAETLAAICVVEAHEPRAPVLYCSSVTSMDPRTGSYLGGGPESVLLCAGTVEMAEYLDLPNAVGGFGSSAKIPGIQASLENMLSAMVCLNVGGEVVNGLGVCDGSTLLSYEQLLLDHEIAGMVLRIGRGIDANPETVATDLIKNVGIGGSYLAQPHTLKHFRELLLPMLWDSEPFDSWVRKGRKDPMDVAREKVDWILKHHEPVPLDRQTSRKLEAIVKDSAQG